MPQPFPKTVTKAFAILFLLGAGIDARQEAPGSLSICGTSITSSKEEYALHLAWTRSAEFRRARAVALARPRTANRDIGNIAIVEDNGDLVARRNAFNLSGRTLRFLPQNTAATSYSYDTADGGYDATQAAGTVLALGDDDSSRVALPFSFPFFGNRYSAIYVNSDGNITFGEGDNSFQARSVARVTAGPPRVAVLFHDMDPTQPGASVHVSTAADYMVISWVSVPAFQDTGIGVPQTFQARLFSNGRIEISYSVVATPNSVVGIAPGRLQGEAALVNFADPPQTVFSGPVLERFSATLEIDMTLTSQRFFETHDDAYDFLVVYNNMNIPATVGNSTPVAYSVTYRSSVEGINQGAVDIGAELGSPNRLQSLLNMGPLSQYSADPNAPVPLRGPTGDTALSLIGHETGHRFLAYASITDATGAKPMLTSDGAHWAFTFNAEASLMSGNRIRDNGASTSPRFFTTDTVSAYAPFDLYLMGFAAPVEPPPSFYVGNTSQNSDALPQKGIGFEGTRHDVSLDDLIAAQNQPRRVPDYTVAQRRFRMAFILMTSAGTQPSAADLAKIETYRSQFTSYFAAATGGRATMETLLKRSADLSVWPAAGVLEGGTRTAKVTLGAPAAATMTFSVQAQSGTLSAPTSVVIPSGSSSVQFDVVGSRAGVGELRVEPNDPNFAGTTAYIQVLAASNIRLNVASGDGQIAVAGQPLPQPVRIQVTDANALGYPGVSVRAVVSSGAVSPSTAVSDANGFVEFLWTPGAGAGQQLTATATGGATVKATATASPMFSSGGIVNAASFQQGLVPGSIATIFGANLAHGATANGVPPLQTDLAGVHVTVGGQAAQLFFVSDAQINMLVPASVPLGTASVVVTAGGASTDPILTPILPVQPAIFQNSGVGAVLVFSTYLEIYATGLGSVALAPSGFNETTVRPRVTLAGNAVDLLYSGPAPTFPGLYQVNVARPAGLTGTVNLQMTMAGMASNSVKVTLP